MFSSFKTYFETSFKYSLILLRYSSTDSYLTQLPQYKYYSKYYLLLLIYYKYFPLLHAQKGFDYLKLFYFLIALFSFLSLKRFLISLTVVLSISFVSLKMFLIYFIVLSFIYFFILKRFLISLIILLSIIFIFYKPQNFNQFMLKKQSKMLSLWQFR